MVNQMINLLYSHIYLYLLEMFLSFLDLVTHRQLFLALVLNNHLITSHIQVLHETDALCLLHAMEYSAYSTFTLDYIFDSYDHIIINCCQAFRFPYSVVDSLCTLHKFLNIECNFECPAFVIKHKLSIELLCLSPSI